ncbi:hypothetical protein BDR22DRAFT_890137 [Usnea florida]
MTSQVGAGGPHPAKEGLAPHQDQKIGMTDESFVHDSTENAVPQPSLENADIVVDHNKEGTSNEAVAEDGTGEAETRAEGHEILLQKLKDRVNGFEQRLRKAGLLEEPEDRSDPKAVQKKEKKTEFPSSSDEIGDKENLVQIQDSSDSTSGEQKSIKILADRIDSLESRLEEAGHLIDKPEPDKPRLPAIPQLHYVGWSEFKNKLVGETTTYAIEVLVGEAKYYYQRSEEERKSKQRLNDHSNERDQPTTEDQKSTPLPERIRINSKPVVLIMNQIDPKSRSEDPIVLLRPFKPLIYHESRIREVFQLLKTKWGNVDREGSTDPAAQSAVTNDKGHNAAVNFSDSIAVSCSPEYETKSNDDEQSPTTETNTKSSKATTDNDPKSKQNAMIEDISDSLEAFKDLGCLIEFMDVELRPVTDSFIGATRQKVSFSDLWHLFKPGDFIHCPLNHKDSAEYLYMNDKPSPNKPEDRYQEVLRVVCTAGGRPHLEESNENYTHYNPKSRSNAFLISAYWVDFNGTRFGPRCFVLTMIPFVGEKDITSLECYPLRYSPEADQLKSRWKSRGEAFREYMTFKYRYYTGKSLTCSPTGYRGPDDDYPKHAENVNSQVVVDFNEAFAAHPEWRLSGSSLDLDAEDSSGELVENYPTSYWKDSDRRVLDSQSDDVIYYDLHVDIKLMEDYVERDALVKEPSRTSRAAKGEFGEDHLVLLPNRIFAFVMRNRKWAMLSVDGLRPIKRYVEGFNDLQLPIGHKRTIRSLVKSHFAGRNADLDDLEAAYDADLVRGKGKGLVILLHGAPGVGKTSTAEAVADAFGKLLFPITCGDLGLTADRVELELSEKFHLAELWDCVLLLDEADVFLARRTNTDIKRNSLVSVFLRVLEHFTGILFLTTNRVGAFDEAFKSRIHISLYYPPLDAQKTRDIWKMNLERLSRKKERRNESMVFDEKEIYAFAQSHYAKTFPLSASWNGRQIRNAFQTASALAEFEAHEWNRKARARSEETGEAFIPRNPQLKVGHFQEIALASYEFDRYISETRGATDAEVALMESQRMDEYRPSRRLLLDREQQPIQIRDAAAPKVAPTHGTNALPRAAPAVSTSSGGVRQGNAGAPTPDTPEPEVQYHRRPGDRAIKPFNTYGAFTAAATSTAERSSAARSRPKAALHPSFYTAHDRERQLHEAFDQHESLYEDEFEEEPMYQDQHEVRSYQPTRSYGHLEDPNQRGESPRRRRGGNLQATNRNRTVIGYDEPLEDEGDEFIG